MLNSNRSALSSEVYQGSANAGGSIADNLLTLDNIQMAQQMRSLEMARSRGDAQAAHDIAIRKHVAQNLGRATIRPLIRKRTAREYADD